MKFIMMMMVLNILVRMFVYCSSMKLNVLLRMVMVMKMVVKFVMNSVIFSIS